MSSLWTPEGERRVPRSAPAGHTPSTPGGGDAGQGGGGGDSGEGAGDEAELAARLEELRDQLLSTPVEIVVANHAYGLFELGAIHLSQQPPSIEQARLAIDALGALVEGLAGRLGEAEPSLVDALAQIRLAFVQIQAAQSAGSPPAEPQTGTAATEPLS